MIKICPVLGEILSASRGSDGCHVDDDTGCGLIDNLRTVFLFVRCDPRDMHCNPTYPPWNFNYRMGGLVPVSRAFPGLN
jgi:hypothetical protein